MISLFANNAQTQLAAAITSTSATSLSVTPGAGSKFPSPGSNQYFVMTLTDAATGLINEILWVTARSGDTMTIMRAQEGTTARTWLVNDFCSCFPTAGTMSNTIQPDQAQKGTYEFVTAGGTANALTATIPSNLTTLPDGMPLRVEITAANTSTMTLNLTLGSSVTGAQPIVKYGNQPLVAGDAPIAGYVLNLNWSATLTSWILQNPATSGGSAIPAGSIFQFPCTTAPSGFLLCNGQLVSRTTYAALWAFANASGNIVADGSWSAGKFSTGDGSTTFRLPQYGGYFLRTLDNGNGIDPSRTIGTTQASTNLSHNHGATTTINDPGHLHSQGVTLGYVGKSYLGNGTSEFSAGGATSFGTGGTPFPTNLAFTGVTATTSTSTSGGSEARPINISVLTCIKY